MVVKEASGSAWRRVVDLRFLRRSVMADGVGLEGAIMDCGRDSVRVWRVCSGFFTYSRWV